jgi:hypothetical protein
MDSDLRGISNLLDGGRDSQRVGTIHSLDGIRVMKSI